jgi:hydrogenase maturation protease
MAAGTLVFAWGNPSRGDDALGLEFLVRIEAWLAATGRGRVAECLADFQLQPEHVIDLHGRALVLFVDACADCAPPFSFSRVTVERDPSFTFHSMTPGALLAAYAQVYARRAPPCYTLAIRGHCFELGEALGSAARCNLDAALALAQTLLETPSPAAWAQLAGDPERDLTGSILSARRQGEPT